MNNFHENRFGIEGIITCQALKGGKVVRETTFHNLITDLGMDAIGTAPEFNRMHLGTGTATPSFTDTALTAFGVNVQASNGVSTSGVATSAPYFGWNRIVWTSSTGGATGVWTEIGISNQNTNGNLRSHALILDAGGSPTSFPVLADEQFRGTYEFRVYAPTADDSRSVLLSGVSYDTVCRPIAVTNVSAWALSVNESISPFLLKGDRFSHSVYTGGLGAVTDFNPVGAAIGVPTSAANAAYVSGNHYREGSITCSGADVVGVIRTVRVGNYYCPFQVEYTPTLNKLNTEIFVHNQRNSWARR